MRRSVRQAVQVDHVRPRRSHMAVAWGAALLTFVSCGVDPGDDNVTVEVRNDSAAAVVITACSNRACSDHPSTVNESIAGQSSLEVNATPGLEVDYEVRSAGSGSPTRRCLSFIAYRASGSVVSRVSRVLISSAHPCDTQTAPVTTVFV